MAADKGRSCKAEGLRAMAGAGKKLRCVALGKKGCSSVIEALVQGQKAGRSRVARGIDFCVA